MYHVPLWMGCLGIILTFLTGTCAICSAFNRFHNKPIFYRIALFAGPTAIIFDGLNLLISTGFITDRRAEGIAIIALFICGGTAALCFLFSAFFGWLSSVSCKRELKEKKPVKESSPVLLYGKPQLGRINPSDPEGPARCPLCSCAFDSGAQLRLELRKDGYGECAFCPRCGRELKEG